MTRSFARAIRVAQATSHAQQHAGQSLTARLALCAARRGYHSSKNLQNYPKEGVFQKNSPQSNLLNRSSQPRDFPQQSHQGFNGQQPPQDDQASVFQQSSYDPPRPRSRLFRRLAQITWLLTASTVGLMVILTLGIDIVPLPLKPGSDEDREELEALKEEFDTLPIVQDLRSQRFVDPMTGQVAPVWQEWRAYKALSDPTSPIASLSRRENALSTGPLKGSQGFAAQTVFWNESGKMAMIFMNFGEAVCGWPGNVHGGAIATFFDESLARVAGRCVKSGSTVTAHLDVDYVAPCHPGQWYVIAATSVPDDVDPMIAEQPEPALSSQKTILKVIRETVERSRKERVKKMAATGEDKAEDVPKKSRKVWVQGKLFCVDEAGPTLQDFAGVGPPDTPDPLHPHAVACGLFVVPKTLSLENGLSLGNIEF